MLIRNLIGAEEIVCDNGKKARLYYYLLREKWGNCDSFGAEIAMERDESWENACIRHITTSPARMEAIIERLQRGAVTPCCLQDIVLEELNKY